VGLAQQVGQVWQREREREGFKQILKQKIELNKEVFLENLLTPN
jgi:hypothetical protein